MHDRSAVYPIILERIAQGESLRSICRTEGMPVISTVMLWINDDPAFSEQYARAREARADYHFEKCIEIAARRPEMVDGDTNHKAGGSRMDSACVAWQRLEYDAHRWAASKMNPKKYADKVDLTHASPEGGPVEFRWKS